MPPWATGRRQNERPDEPPTITYLTNVTNKMGAKILETHGKTYRVGQSRDVVGYAAGGTTEDYAYERTSDGGLGKGLELDDLVRRPNVGQIIANVGVSNHEN